MTRKEFEGIIRPMKSIAFATVFSLAALAQTSMSSPKFEVVSAKIAAPITANEKGRPSGRQPGGPGTADPEHISWRATSLASLIRSAFGIKALQMDGPAWLSGSDSNTRYDIKATLPANATAPQLDAMLRNLLQERFGLRTHFETRERPGYTLVVSRSGTKLQPSKANEERSFFLTMPIEGGSEFRASKTSMVTLAEALEAVLAAEGAVVQDKTGLNGSYDIQLPFASTNVGVESSPLPSIFTALEESLGLQLEKGKVQVEVLVIDSVNKVPTEN